MRTSAMRLVVMPLLLAASCRNQLFDIYQYVVSGIGVTFVQLDHRTSSHNLGPGKGHREQLVTTEAFSTETRSAGKPCRFVKKCKKKNRFSH